MSTTVALVGGSVVAALVSAMLLRWLVLRWWRSRVARLRIRRAQRGERAAELLLQDAGYDIVERQPQITWSIGSDDDYIDIDLRADLVVRRDDRLYVAEIKTGAAAPSLRNARTRRQLLEYHIAYNVDGVLLVDVEADAVHDVRFDISP